MTVEEAVVDGATPKEEEAGGLDLGQSRNFTAITTLERAPLGPPYPEIVETARAPEL